MAIAGATAGYRRWRSVQDSAALSGGADAPVARLASVAAGKQLDTDKFIAATYYKARGRKMIRPGAIVSIKPLSLGTPNANGLVTKVTLTVCRDVSKALIQQNGRSTSVADGPSHLVDTATMTLVDGTWKTTDLSNKPTEGCE